MGRTSRVEIDDSACNDNKPDCDEVQHFSKWDDYLIVEMKLL